MSLKQAQQKSDKAWAAWMASPSPATKAASQAAFASLVKAQQKAWAGGREWMFSPDTQPK